MARERLKEVRNINYLSRDFDTIKQSLIENIKQNFPNDFQDFNEASGGMALLEAVAYMGDILSFYIDRRANEPFIQRAIEEKNIISNAEAKGRKPRTSIPAVVDLTLSAVINAATSANSLFTIKKGTRVQTLLEPSISFELLNDVDFSLTANRTLDNDGQAVTASISSVSAIAGSTRSFTTSVGNPVKFLKLTLPDQDINEIISVTASDQTEYYQVDTLAQDTIFVGEENTTSTSGDTPFVLKVRRIPYRFTVEPEIGGGASIRFGSGINNNLEDSEIVPNPEDFVLPTTIRGSVSGFSPALINSQQFLDTKSLGAAPANVSIDIKYRFGGGLLSNVGSNTITKITGLDIEYKNPNFSSVSSTQADFIERNLSVTNPEPAYGGRDRETLLEIRENSAAYYASQQRAVTLQDYQIISMSMPSNYGTVFRSMARKDTANNLGVELMVVSQNTDSQLVAAGNILKNNIETFVKRYKSFADSVRITDGKIVNIGIDFSIVPEPNINANEALLEAFFLLKREFDISRTNFNDFVVIADITSKLQAIRTIRSVASFKITNITGTKDSRSYSNNEFNISTNTTNGIIRFPEDVIWEVKFPNYDIFGRTL